MDTRAWGAPMAAQVLPWTGLSATRGWTRGASFKALTLKPYREALVITESLKAMNPQCFSKSRHCLTIKAPPVPRPVAQRLAIVGSHFVLSLA